MALPTWVPDDETKPAPMPLLVVQSFVNTWEADSGMDLLADPVAGPQWLEQTGLADGPVDLVEVRDIRESIRTLLVQNSDGQPPDPVRLGPLRDLANRVRLRVAVLDDGSVEVQSRRGHGGAAGPPAPYHPRRATRRLVGTAEGLPQPGLPLGLLRPLPRGPGGMVRHGRVRQPNEEPEPPSPALS